MIFRKFAAITLLPFILMNKNYKDNKTLVNHETIHLKQLLEMKRYEVFGKEKNLEVWKYLKLLRKK
jgi:hypothetical protein